MGNQTGWTKPEEESFKTSIIQWFENEGRHELPWRLTRDPYAILVSELMLQQTQVVTVLNRGFFENWLEKFPDVQSLAVAGEDEVLKAWEGLGYYNRARNLQKAAAEIVKNHDGIFPIEFADILDLPGVGRYTAGAVSSFAYGKSAPVVDGNVIRVFSRIFGYTEPVDTTQGQKQMWEWAEVLVPDEGARAYNSGLMEIGQRVCRKSSPICESCPIRKLCCAYKQQMAMDELPLKRNRQKIENVTESVGFFRDENRILLTLEKGTRRKGLWRLPEVNPKKDPDRPQIFELSYGITKYRVRLVVYRGTPNEAEELELEGQWFVVPEETDKCAMAAPYRKALKTLIENEFPAECWKLE